MMHYIGICGPAGWGLLFISLVVTAMTIQTIVLFIRHRGGQRIKIKHRLSALIFWGFMGAVLGFLGQTSAIHKAMTVIIPAKSISPEMIDRGFRESFLPSFWGFGILVSSVILFYLFRGILRYGSKKPGNGPLKNGAGMGKALWTLLILNVICIPASSFAGQGPVTPNVLTEKVWKGKAGPEDVVFSVWPAVDGTLSGEAHTIRGGKHMTQCPALHVAWNDPNLEMHMKTGVILKGKLDRATNRISASLEYNGNILGELQLDGTDPKDIQGLLARPAPSAGEAIYSYSVPTETGDGWQSTGPEAIGLGRAELEALVTDIIEGKAGVLHSVLVASGGRLILEEYFHGYARGDLHRLASVTKSVSSLLAGIAIDRGDIDGVETPLKDFFPQHEDILSVAWNDVTLKHLLTMSIGTEWTEEEAEMTHGAGNGFFREILSRKFAHKPGEKWQYVSANVNLLGGIIRKATGKHADEYASTHLFGPLGIERWNWDYGMVDGYSLMDGSLMLRPRDMAKLGTLVADRGSWNGEQVVTAEWIAESTSPHIIPSEEGSEKYGYLWWLFFIPSSSGVQEAIVANGKGSQFIAVFPALDLVIVTTGSNDDNGMQFAIGKLLSMYVLSSVQAPG